MTTYHQRRRALIRLLLIAISTGVIASCALWYSATATTITLLRLHHDQDRSGTVTAGDIPAAGVEVAVTQVGCTNICTAWIDIADANGHVSLALEAGEYEIEAACMVMVVQASDVTGQAVSDMTTCGLVLWLPVVAK